MSKRIRFHLNEHLPLAVAEGLRRRGIDITTSPEIGLLKASDEEHLAYARREGRVIVTQDQDFLRLHSRGISHAGIAYCRRGTRTIGQIIRSLVLIYERLSLEEMEGRVEYL